MRRRGTFRSRLGAALGASLVAASGLAGHYRWTTNGPEAGLIYQIVVNPTQPSRILVLAGITGRLLFETQDGGQTWSQSENLLYANRLLTDPSSPQTLYAIGYTGSSSGVLKSGDGGSNWAPSGSGLPPEFLPSALAVAPSAPGTLYVVSGGNPGHAYLSVDGAASWTLLAGDIATYNPGDMIVDPNDASVLYVTTGTGLLKSIDGGASFSPLAGAPATARLFFDGRAPATLYASGASSGLSKTTDGGGSWHPADSGFAGQTIWDLAWDPSDPQKLFAASLGAYPAPGGFYVSTDRAGHWSPVSLDSPVTAATAVAIDPEDASRVYASASESAAHGAFHASVDGGAQWTTGGSGLSGYISHDVKCDAEDGQVALGVSNAGVYRTDDAGGGWTLLGTAPVPIVSLAADPTNGLNLYAGYLSLGVPGVVKSTDGGATWDPASDGIVATNMYQVAVSPSATDHLLAATDAGVFGTADAAGAWSPLLGSAARSVAFDSADASILYAGLNSSPGPGGELQRSADGGATWNPPSGLPAGDFNVFGVVVAPADAARVYAALGSGIYRSTDRGLSFSPSVAGLPAGFMPFRLAGDAANPDLLIAAGQTTPAAADGPSATLAPPIVWLTRDGAGSWIPVPSILPEGLGFFNVGVASGGRTFYASTFSGIFQFRRSFADVPDADLFWTAVDAAAMNGVTAGCGSGNFCPSTPTSRASVAAFLLRGRNGGLYLPPPATGTVFGDVPVGSVAADFVEELFHEGVTAGCGGGNYCPAALLSRAEMAVLLLKTEHGSDYAPPPATGTVFGDVPADAFAAAWIEQLFAEGIAVGCGSGNFCPDASLSRAQAAALIVRAFGLS